jgi:hypothetical protein
MNVDVIAKKLKGEIAFFSLCYLPMPGKEDTVEMNAGADEVGIYHYERMLGE